MRPNAALNYAARPVRFSPLTSSFKRGANVPNRRAFREYRACMGSIGAVPASKFSSTANRMSASRTPSRGTPVDLAYAARIARLES